MSDASRLGYLLRYFPTVSETFVYDEIASVARRVQPPAVWALDPGPEAPLHPGLDALLTRCRYVPRAHHPAVVGRTMLGRDRPALRRRWRSWGCRPKDLRRAIYLATLCREAGVDHLHVHFAAEAAEAAWAASQVASVSYSVTVHARDLFCARASLLEVLSGARAVVTISEHNRRHLRALGVDPRRLHVVRQGIPLPRARAPRRRRDGGALHVLFVGRMVDKKGGDVLLGAVAELSGRGRRVRATMVGDGPRDESWRALARREGIDQRVRWTGALPRDEVAALMRDWAHVVVLPCRVAADGDRDGIPVALMEGMAHALPVISTPVSGVPELIEDGRTGLLVRPDDRRALAEALGRVADDRDTADDLARAGRLHVEREHDVGRQVERLMRVIGIR